jgi:hypothetical protein
MGSVGDDEQTITVLITGFAVSIRDAPHGKLLCHPRDTNLNPPSISLQREETN